MLVIPGTVAEITPEWLSHVLGAPVRSTQLLDSHTGTTGRAVLEVDYASSEPLTRRLFVKLPPKDEAQRAFVVSTGMGRREAIFYRTLSAEVPVRVPRCYHSDWDDSGSAYIMLLEHLEDSGCTFRAASQHYSQSWLCSVMDAFTRLHAHYWRSPRFETDLDWLGLPLQHDMTGPLIERALESHASRMPPVFRQMGELYLSHCDAIHRLWESGEHTLIHGDVHDANMFLDGAEPGFLDWALAARGPAMRDVGYFLAATLSGEDQETSAGDLLQYYRGGLIKLGAPAPGLAELWEQYRWHSAYVWVGAAVTLAMGDAWQPVNYVTSSLQRIHSSLDALGSVDAIRSAL